MTAHDEERWSVHLGEPRCRQVRAAASRDDRGDLLGQIGRRPERGGRAGACPEVGRRETANVRTLAESPCRTDQPPGEQVDVEDVGAVSFLLGSE